MKQDKDQPDLFSWAKLHPYDNRTKNKDQEDEIDKQMDRDVRAGLYGMDRALSRYLGDVFWEEFYAWIRKPKGTEAGERVVYKMKEGIVPVRHETTPNELEAMQQEIATMTGVDRSRVTMKAAVTSGLPYPRLIDLPGWEIIFDVPLTKYADSEDLLPRQDFPIIWALGVFFAQSDKTLAHIDFVHPLVKGVFSVVYESRYGLDYSTDNIIDWHDEFQRKMSEYKKKADAKDCKCKWAKIIQFNEKLLIKTKY